MNGLLKLTGIILMWLTCAGSYVFSEFSNDSSVLSMDDEISTDFEKNLEGLSSLQYLTDSFVSRTVDFVEIDSSTIVNDFSSISDSVFIARLSSIPTIVDLSYNKIVRRFIEVYLTQRQETLERMIGLAKYYFPIFDEIFDYYDVPNEMKYMSIIESALNPRAVSRAGAVGLWQFMYGTGKDNGLIINSLVDERRDPVKSTYAALKYVKKLYGYYGDWLMVIAAYNCGPGNVNKAIRRSGGKRNYWAIYYYLPRETRGHVPAFIAANYVMNFYREHGFKGIEIDLPPLNDTIMIMDNLHLKQVAEVLDIPVQLVRDMNPQYRADIIPATAKIKFALRLPEDKTLEFIDREREIFTYKDSVFFDPSKNLNTPQYTHSQYYSVPPPGYVKLVYTVKSGDNLGFISEWYNVGISKIKYWNRLRRNTIYSGQKLIIYVPKNKVSYYKKINTMSFTEKQKMVGNPVPSGNTIHHDDSNGEYIFYTVKNGDTLWEIAQQFQGVTDADIMRLNNITNASKIKPGQRLKIKKKI